MFPRVGLDRLRKSNKVREWVCVPGCSLQGCSMMFKGGQGSTVIACLPGSLYWQVSARQNLPLCSRENPSNQQCIFQHLNRISIHCYLFSNESYCELGACFCWFFYLFGWFLQFHNPKQSKVSQTKSEEGPYFVAPLCPPWSQSCSALETVPSYRKGFWLGKADLGKANTFSHASSDTLLLAPLSCCYSSSCCCCL